MSRPLRILLVSNKCPPDFDGGYELRAFQIASALRDRGHDVDLVTSKFRDSFRGERKDPEWVYRIFRYVGISPHQGWRRRIDRILRHLQSTTVAGENFPAMEAFLTAHHDPYAKDPNGSTDDRPYDVAYCFGMLRVSFAVAVPIQQRRIPILYHAGSTCMADHFHHYPAKIPGYRLAMQWLTRGWYQMESTLELRHVAYVSEFLRDLEAARGHRPPWSTIIPRGIDFPMATDLKGERASPPKFFLACRIDPMKGVHNALAAAAELQRSHPEWPWQMEVAGESLLLEYREELYAQIEREDLEKRVVFLGRLGREETLRHMRAATAFIFASVYGEPFSSTIIEAMACGTPLIGSDDGSILEVVEPGVSALIFRKNQPSELATHLERVLGDPALCRRLIAAGLQTVQERYTIDRILQLTEETLETVIANTNSSGRLWSATPAAA